MEPLVTIGVPVFNGERYLEASLASLGAQDYPNLRILISDNASTDRTPEIIERFARDDPRVQVVRSDRNVGAPANFNRCFELSSGPYFLWGADDDLWEPSYVRRCVEALEANPRAVLACSRVRFIDADGNPIELDYARLDNPDLSTPSVVQRMRTLLYRTAWFQIYGVIRRDALARTRLTTEQFGADVVLLTELLLLGPFVLVPEVLHRYRQFLGRPLQEQVKRMDVEIPELARGWWPYTILQEGISGAVARSALPARTKLRLQLEILLASYFRDSTISQATRIEVGVRARAALRRRWIRELLKFGLIAALRPAYRVLRKVRRAVRRARTNPPRRRVGG